MLPLTSAERAGKRPRGDRYGACFTMSAAMPRRRWYHGVSPSISVMGSRPSLAYSLEPKMTRSGSSSGNANPPPGRRSSESRPTRVVSSTSRRRISRMVVSYSAGSVK